MDNLTQRQKQALETRQKIYECAVDLFKSHPYDEVKITDICEKAGVSVGVFYHYFPSKSHVFNEGYRNIEVYLRDYLDTLAADPIKTIELIVREYLLVNHRNGSDYMGVFLRNQLETKDPLSLRRVVKNIFRECLQGAIDAKLLAGDAEQITDLIYRALKGILFEWSIDDSFSLVEEGLKITQIILDQFSAKP